MISVYPGSLKPLSVAQAFSDVSGLCPLLYPVVKPVRQFLRPLDVEKGAFLQAEVQRLKEQEFIRPCLGPFASAVVLVPESIGLHQRVDCWRASAAAWTTRYRCVG